MSLYDLAVRSIPPQTVATATFSSEAVESGGSHSTTTIPVTDIDVDTAKRSALSLLSSFVPTESITIYLAAMATASAFQQQVPWVTVEFIFWSGAVVTAGLFIIGVIHERAIRNIDLWQKFPFWKLFAAVIAFICWALAVPNSPYLGDSAAGRAVAGFLAIFISIILERVDRLVVSLNKVNPK
jgi:hypothetical protein